MKKINFIASTTLLVAGLSMSSCSDNASDKTTLSGLQRENFRTVIAGVETDLYTLSNENGMEVCFTNHGARMISIMVPDCNGVMRDVILGFDSIQGYVDAATDFGATVGRYANRINKGQITLDGVDYQLSCNNFGHCLHGGLHGFQTQVFDVVNHTDSTLTMLYRAKDGEEGFPGNIDCYVTYTLTSNNAIDITYKATTDKTTIVNLANHAYFNLDGDASQPNSHYLFYINANGFTPVDSTLMTSGEIRDVTGTPMDFRTPTAIGSRIDNDDEQLQHGGGYDHNWCLATGGDIDVVAARLTSPTSGIVLEVYTDQPGLQVYTGNFLDGTVVGKGSIPCAYRSAVVLETQKYPNSPNHSHWTSPILRPDEIYVARCIYKFDVVKQ